MLVVGRWAEKFVREVRSSDATGLRRSAAGEGGGGGLGWGAFNWTGEENSAPEFRRARVQEAQAARHFQRSTPRLQAHAKLDLPCVSRRS